MQLGCSPLSVIELSLLEVQIFTHLIHLLLAWELFLPGKSLAHVQQQGFDGVLSLFDLLCVSLLLLLKLFDVVINFFFFLVQNLVLLHVFAAILFLVFEVQVDILDVSLVSLNHSAAFCNLLFLLLDFRVVLLDPIHQTLTGLWEGKVHLVGLEL